MFYFQFMTTNGLKIHKFVLITNEYKFKQSTKILNHIDKLQIVEDLLQITCQK